MKPKNDLDEGEDEEDGVGTPTLCVRAEEQIL